MSTSTAINGGWKFTAFSNPEAFSIAVVSGFASVFESAAMENEGVYANNARNAMIQRWGDRQYIEAGNLSLLHSHGNPYGGPALEHVPSMIQWAGIYEWGDQGRLQWVALGGCDILGFATFPDGRPALNSQPRPDRWQDMFKGISGVLGYRSASWYQKENPGLGAATGSAFANFLLSGMTFFDAWAAAGDYLHRRIGKQAEVAAFVSSANAYRDTLSVYMPERPIGLDQTAILRRTVGYGDAPHYDYCERVDFNGQYTCYRAESAPPTQISPNIWMSVEPDWGIASYPMLEESREQRSAHSELEKLLSGRRLAPNPIPDLQYIGLDDGPDMPSLRGKVADALAKGGFVRMAEDVVSDERWCAHRVVIAGGREIPVFDDFGVVLETTREGAVGRLSPWPESFECTSELELSLKRDALVDRLRLVSEHYSWVVVEDVIPVYIKQVTAARRQLVPRLAAYLHCASAGRVDHFVEIICC